MPKHHTFPALYNECKTISITQLKEWGYLEPNSIKSGAIHWSRHGERYASIGFTLNLFCDRPYLELDYKSNGTPIKYKVYLCSTVPNIGKGKIYYFICPNTGKRCRKLYLVKTYFLHRSAFRGAMYECQTYSKFVRSEIAGMKRLFGSDEALEQLHKKYFKKYYKGKLTKKYLRILKSLNS